MKLLVHWERIVVVGTGIFLILMIIIGCVMFQHQEYKRLHPVYPEQYTAGAVIDQSVGRAIEKYQAVLDSEQNNPDCTLSNCPISSKYLPGVPEDRALFTNAERNNVRWSSSNEQTKSDFSIYSVNVKEDKTVEAIVYVRKTTCIATKEGEKHSGGTFLHRMILIPSLLDGSEYVVMEDVDLGLEAGHQYPGSFDPLYSSHEETTALYPPCPNVSESNRH